MTEVHVRRLRPGDEKIVEMCVAIGDAKYPQFDTGAAYAWGCAALDRDDVAIFVTKHCFVMAVTYERFWAPAERHADWQLLCSSRDDKRSAGQIRALARAVVAWAIDRGARQLEIGPTLKKAMGRLAQAIGPTRQETSWVIDLPGKGA